MKKLILFISFILLVFTSKAQLIDLTFPQTNGEVSTIDAKGDTMLIGGSFTKVYGTDSSSTYGAALDRNTGAVYNFPKPNGTVNKVIPDGKKGFFIGGEFTKIGDSIRNSIAHIDSLGNVSSILANHGTDGVVNTLSLKNDTLYFCGNFNNVGGFINNSIGLINTNGELNKGLPKINGNVFAIAPDGKGGWIIGGDFTKVGEYNKKFLARIDYSGNLLNWGPQIDTTVEKILVDNNTVFIGGKFLNIDGQSKKYLAAINLQTGKATTWNPNANGKVIDMVVHTNLLYVCGDFNNIGGQNRTYLAAIDRITGLATTWNPKLNGGVRCLAINNNRLYVGGSFSIFDNTYFVKNLTSFDLANGNFTFFNGQVNQPVSKMIAYNNNIYISGEFTHVNSIPRNGIASFDISDNVRTWPGFSAISGGGALAAWNNNIYIGGSIDTFGAAKTKNFSVLNAITGAIVPLRCDANTSQVPVISVWNGNIAIGGRFTSIGGDYRYNMASVNIATNTITYWAPEIEATHNAYDFCINGNYGYWNTGSSFGEVEISTGKPTTWEPDFDGDVDAIFASNNRLYVGGNFSVVDGVLNKNFCVFDLATRTLINWPDKPSGWVHEMFQLEDTLYICGRFSSVGGKSRSKIAGINIQNGKVTDWIPPNITGNVFSMTLLGDSLYFGGDFTKVNGVARNYLAAINFKTKALLDWNPNPNNEVLTVGNSGGKIYSGGFFTSVWGSDRKYFAAINLITGEVLPLKADASKPLGSIAIAGNTAFISGLFDTIAGQKRSCLASLNLTSGTLTTWNPGANSSSHLLIKNNELFVGGGFTVIDGKNQKALASFNINTGAITNFNPNINFGGINDMDTLGSTLYICGNFQNILGQNRAGVAAININTKSLLSWEPKASGSSVIRALKAYGKTIYIGGIFSAVNGQLRNNMAAVDAQTAAVKPWNPDVGNYVYEIEAVENRVLVGGNFGIVAGNPLEAFADIDTGTGLVNYSGFSFKSHEFNVVYSVHKIYFHKAKLYFGGNFTTSILAPYPLIGYFQPYNKNLMRTDGIKWKLSMDSISIKPYCAGSSIKVPFAMQPEANAGNTFTVELSDTAGYFGNPTVIGTSNQTSSGQIQCSIPLSTPGGKYRVRITSSDPPFTTLDNGYDITVTNTTLKAGFNVDDSLKCTSPAIFQIIDTSLVLPAANVTRKWTFSDGFSDTSKTITRVISQKGKHEVSLFVSANGCIDSTQRTIYVGEKPEAGFSTNNKQQCLKNNLFDFEDTTVNTDSIFARLWQLSDGFTDTARKFSRNFHQPGIYNLSLITQNTYCADTASDSIQVYPFPVVGFNLNTIKQCYNNQNFILEDTSNVLSRNFSREWVFADGNTDTSKIVLKTFNNTGSYETSLKITTDNGCTDSAKTTLIVNPIPSVSFTCSDTSFCEGDSAALSASVSPGANLLWYKDNNQLTEINPLLYVHQTGKYHLKAIDTAGGCDSVAPSIQVNVYPYPLKPTIIQNNFLLISSSKIGNQWIFNGSEVAGATDTSYLASFNGIYKVKVTENNCSAYSDSINILNVSVDAMLNENDFFIYPNPTINNIHISSKLSGLSLKIINVQGTNLGEMDISQENNISLENYPSGIYYFEIWKGPEKQMIYKIIKK